MSHLAGHTARPPLEAIIVMSAVGCGCAYATFVGLHTLSRHNDVALNRARGQTAYMTDGNNSILSRNFALKLWKSRLSIGDSNYNEDNKA